MAEHHYVAFWNVENLFDSVDWTGRPDWFQKRIEGELKGWTTEVRDKKLRQLASIINRMNDGKGPDVLSVCEVESERVLKELCRHLNAPGRAYAVAHVEMHDKRGIDVAFIYDGNRYETDRTKWFSHVILKREATRDLFQINLATRQKPACELILIGNHWPSRSGGHFESEPYRMIAGETLAYWHERIVEEKGPDVAVIAMGDFNDQPFDRSITDYALSFRDRAKVLNASKPKFFNLMWPLLGQGRGTHYHENFANMLDQFMVSKGLINGKGPLRVIEDSVGIVAFPDMTRPGDYPGPIRFGRPTRSDRADPDFTGKGYSDHFPIALVLEAA